MGWTTSHIHQGPWPWNCEGHWFLYEGCTMLEITSCSWLMILGGCTQLPLGGTLTQMPTRPWNNICSLPYRNWCRLFVHHDFFGPLDLHLLMWSEFGQYLPFDQWEILECNGHGPLILCMKRPWPPICDSNYCLFPWGGPLNEFS